MDTEALEDPLGPDADVAPEEALQGARRDVVHGGEVLDASFGPDMTHALDDIGDERCVRVVDLGARCQACFDLGDNRVQRAAGGVEFALVQVVPEGGFEGDAAIGDLGGHAVLRDRPVGAAGAPAYVAKREPRTSRFEARYGPVNGLTTTRSTR